MFLSPDYNLSSIYEINLEELKAQGIKGLLFDLDSTLMASKSAQYSEETLNWLNEVRKDFFIAVVSNNHNPKYIEKVKKISNFPTLFEAKKPQTKKVLEFLHEYGVASCECALVGDRPLTDILCGKRLGCKTILVDSITANSETKIVRFARWLERLTIKK
jgi:hypothetical protein